VAPDMAHSKEFVTVPVIARTRADGEIPRAWALPAVTLTFVASTLGIHWLMLVTA